MGVTAVIERKDVDSRPWWQFWGGKETKGYWSDVPQRVTSCTESVTINGKEHHCRTEGEHWTHTCASKTGRKKTCGFRWAK